MKLLKKIILFVLIILIGIQFIPTKFNQSSKLQTTDFMTTFDVPKEIAQKLKTACYDCHSNNTYYPWYNKIQPVAWFLEHHIEEAKEELNFSVFGNYSKRRQKSKLKSVVQEIRDGKMPLKSYTIMHKKAKFSKEETEQISTWIENLKNTIK